MGKIGLFFGIALICSSANAIDKIEVIRDIPDMPKDKIYSTAKQWIAENFISAQDVIQFDDKDAGTLIAKGQFDFPCSSTWSCTVTGGEVVKFTMRVDAKDQKIRVSFDRISVSLNAGPTLGTVVKKSLSKRQEGILNKRFSGLANSVVYNVEQASEIKNDDW